MSPIPVTAIILYHSTPSTNNDFGHQSLVWTESHAYEPTVQAEQGLKNKVRKLKN